MILCLKRQFWANGDFGEELLKSACSSKINKFPTDFSRRFAKFSLLAFFLFIWKRIWRGGQRVKSERRSR